MRIFVGITDNDWFDLLAEQSRRGLDEVNFWTTSDRAFRGLEPGGLFLFKLRTPRRLIGGGAFFTRAPQISIRLAWEAFGITNGASNMASLLARISEIRKARGLTTSLDTEITCIILSEPFFFGPDDQIPIPTEFSRYNQTGCGYRTEDEVGRRLYAQVQERLARAQVLDRGPAQFMVGETPRFGAPITVAPRLGQGGFRIGVLEAYQRRCAITGERTLPVLDAAHIRPFSDGGGHELRNGILLRRDLHRLFDLGYLAVGPDDQRVQVSSRIRTEFENGREYYALSGRPLAVPREAGAVPAPEFLRYHFDNVYRG